MIKDLNEVDFDKAIAGDKVIIDFWAPWCGPCKIFSPTLDEIDKEVADFTIYKVNVDNYPALAGRQNVHSIPTLLFYRRGKLVDSSIGVVSKSVILQKLERMND
jgi:thioredoxin 1